MIDIKKFIANVRAKSKFYADLYQGLPGDINLEDLPFIEEKSFWESNSITDNKVLTDSLSNGIVLKTGGTTGNPKLSAYSWQEWRDFSKQFSDKLVQNNWLKSNSRVANLFVSGELYGAFLLYHDMLNIKQTPLLELPISWGASITVESTVNLIKELKAQVILAPPYRLLQIADYISENKITGLHLDTLLYAGDLLLKSQKKFILNVLPNIRISSLGYASTDSGYIGYTDETCDVNEYRFDPNISILEIVDPETGQLIQEMNKAGRLYITNLTKFLMPVIRYPVGDLAMWLEPEESQNRKYRLAGRFSLKDDKIDFLGVKIDYNDIQKIIDKTYLNEKIVAFQLIFNNEKQRTMSFNLACPNVSDAEKNKIEESLKENLKTIIEDQNQCNSLIKQVKIEFIKISDIKYSQRTYKAIKIEDNPQ